MTYTHNIVSIITQLHIVRDIRLAEPAPDTARFHRFLDSLAAELRERGVRIVELDTAALDDIYLGGFSGLLLHAELWRDEADGSMRERYALYDGAEGISLLLNDRHAVSPGECEKSRAGRRLSLRLHAMRAVLNNVIDGVYASGGS